MMTATVTEIRPRRPIGGRVELARYAVSGGPRIISAQHIDGRLVGVTDGPAGGTGSAYPVAHDPAGGGPALDALIARYLARALALDAVPAAADLARALAPRREGRLRREPRGRSRGDRLPARW